MSLQPQPLPSVPEATARVAAAAFPKGNHYLKLRDELGALFQDKDFATLYPHRGRPGLSPWRLALVTIFQFLENLSDREAADAVRARIDWKYALCLELDDPGFHFTALVKFRERLLEGNAEHLLLDRMLAHFRERELLKARGRQRTDSTHVLAAIRTMNRLELVTESLRAVLNDLAEVAPQWLKSWTPPEWFERYGSRAEQSRLPRGDKARLEYAQTVGQDIQRLFAALGSLPELEQLPTVATLRQVWERHYARSEVGPMAWRDDKDLGRAATAIESPYDSEARHSTKHDLHWTGYKVHLTEACDPELPRVITHVHTSVATTQDVSCTADIHQALSDKELLPACHLVDAGYVDADLLVSSWKQHQVQLFGPPRGAKGWQVREGGFTQSQFVVDWDAQHAICPEGKRSVYWHPTVQKPYNRPVVWVRFASADCTSCPSRDRCVRSSAGRPRSLVLPAREQYEALEQTRQKMDSSEGQALYRQRAGVEGSHTQGIRRCGLRQSRYRGLRKTHLQHLATAAALNVVRVVNHLNQVPLAPTRTSRFARIASRI